MYHGSIIRHRNILGYNSPMKTRTIIVFGGAFSPPTLAHEAILRQCLRLPDISEVWLLPSGHRTDKTISVTHDHQLALLQIERDVVFRGEKRLKIDDREIRRPLVTETDDTYRELQQAYPDTNFWFVFGADSYSTIRSWQNGDWLADHLPVLIAPRGNATLPAPKPNTMILPPMSNALQQVSSTTVRAELARAQPIDAYVSRPIGNYIRHYNLFAES